ncbi:hypothetical protein ESCNG_80006 [Neisseria gonorrhoeae]|nr:hypothetical protein ESCNG_80006 [Neisseria gonorrhoeae]
MKRFYFSDGLSTNGNKAFCLNPVYDYSIQ